jgi:hypothetical protein
MAATDFDWLGNAQVGCVHFTRTVFGKWIVGRRPLPTAIATRVENYATAARR